MHFSDYNFNERVIETSNISQADDRDICMEEMTESFISYRLKQGSVILVCMPNSRNLLKLFFAILSAGYVPAMISPTTPKLRIRQMADDFHAAGIIKTRMTAEFIHAMDFSETARQRLWDIGYFENAMPPLTEAGDVILTTSGTSSEFSSGCVHAYESLRKNGQKHAAAIHLSSKDTVLVNLPLYYSFALVAQAIACIDLNAKLVISGPPFIPAQYFNDIRQHGITVSSITPLLTRQILTCEEDSFPDDFRALTVGGDLLPIDDVLHFRTRYPTKELYLTYGITEAGPRVATAAAHRHESDIGRLASIGKPMKNTELMIVPGKDNPNEGELLVHSDTLLKKKIGRNATNPIVEIGNKKWLKTGDIFYMDHEGHLFFRNRKSDFIVVNDEKVNLAAIKQYCRRFSGVLACKTKPLGENSKINGFSMEIIADEQIVAGIDIDDLKVKILSGLKRYERPASLQFQLINKRNLETYK